MEIRWPSNVYQDIQSMKKISITWKVYGFVLITTTSSKCTTLDCLMITGKTTTMEIQIIYNVRDYCKIHNSTRLMAMDLCSASLADSFLPNDHPKKYREPLPAQREGLLQMASGLEYLHSKRIVHGNLKPQNILVSTGECVTFKLSADVGQSRQQSRQVLSVWMAPELLETVHYVPRQQILDTLQYLSDFPPTMGNVQVTNLPSIV